jgi:scyllo-inositol 2-dehydrogenase (NADP+)
MSSSRQVRIGIIGTGWVATARHIPCFKRLSRSRIVGVVDRDLARAQTVAKRWAIPAAFGTVRELLDSGADAVAICTPPWTHASIALEAIEAGVHVLTEKPMATSVASATQMVDAARLRSTSICVCHNLLFARSMQRAQWVLSQRPEESVLHVAGLQLSSAHRRLPKWYPSLPGGLLFDEAPHMLYIMRHLMGEMKLTSAVSRDAPANRHQPVRSIQASCESASASGTLLMVFDSPVSEWLVTAVTQSRVLVLDLFRDLLTVIPSDGTHRPIDVLRTSLRYFVQHAMGVAATGTRHLMRRLWVGHDVLIEGFVHSLITQSPPPVSGEDGLAVMRMLDDIVNACGLNKA